jgi:hypothetical protein
MRSTASALRAPRKVRLKPRLLNGKQQWFAVTHNTLVAQIVPDRRTRFDDGRVSYDYGYTVWGGAIAKVATFFASFNDAVAFTKTAPLFRAIR